MVQVTIGIPTLNGPDRLFRCLRSIGQHTSWGSCGDVKVLVVDDGSTEELLKTNKDMVHIASGLYPQMGLEMLMHNERRGIARGWNALTRHRGSEVVALMNDDIEVVDDWLDVLVYSVTKNGHAGMVGLNSYVGVTKASVPFPPPRVDYCEGRLLGGGSNGLVSSQGPLFAFRREMFDRVGGFDERYFCFYEEVDFGIALRQAGFHHYMADYPRVFHMGGATNSKPENLDAAKHMAESAEKFRQKWGATLGDLRAGFGPSPGCDEWNTQIKNWR
ncbi:MAG TPA: glycosyltransferase [Gemmatimonadaceae bacterium]|nr:glycosyltransferase [Gemmatimonadaceae bacterium]